MKNFASQNGMYVGYTFAGAKILQRPSIPLRIQTIDVTSAVNSPQAPLRHMRASA